MSQEYANNLVPKKPQFSVKAKGQEGYIGNTWFAEGKFGPYISVKLNCNLQEGATLYLHPRKDFTGVLRP